MLRVLMDKKQKCSSCGGKKINMTRQFLDKLLTKKDYKSLECLNCKGTGYEPN